MGRLDCRSIENSVGGICALGAHPLCAAACFAWARFMRCDLVLHVVVGCWLD